MYNYQFFIACCRLMYTCRSKKLCLIWLTDTRRLKISRMSSLILTGIMKSIWSSFPTVRYSRMTKLFFVVVSEKTAPHPSSCCCWRYQAITVKLPATPYNVNILASYKDTVRKIREMVQTLNLTTSLFSAINNFLKLTAFLHLLASKQWQPLF